MVVGLGVDLFDIARMEAELGRGDSGFTRQVFTPAEIADCDRRRRPARQYAVRFAAKEAIVKALSARGAVTVPWTDMDLRDDGTGNWQVFLRAQAREQAEQLGVSRVFLSVAHTGAVALASVVLESSP
jgi:holo-[acyl-carrier protein] synthase